MLFAASGPFAHISPSAIVAGSFRSRLQETRKAIWRTFVGCSIAAAIRRLAGGSRCTFWLCLMMWSTAWCQGAKFCKLSMPLTQHQEHRTHTIAPIKYCTQGPEGRYQKPSAGHSPYHSLSQASPQVLAYSVDLFLNMISGV